MKQTMVWVPVFIRVCLLPPCFRLALVSDIDFDYPFQGDANQCMRVSSALEAGTVRTYAAFRSTLVFVLKDSSFLGLGQPV